MNNKLNNTPFMSFFSRTIFDVFCNSNKLLQCLRWYESNSMVKRIFVVFLINVYPNEVMKVLISKHIKYNEYNIYKDILRSKGKNKIKCDRKWIKFHFNQLFFNLIEIWKFIVQRQSLHSLMVISVVHCTISRKLLDQFRGKM